MNPVSFAVISRDNYLQSELKSLFTPPDHQAVFYEDPNKVILDPSLLNSSQYVVVDLAHCTIPESLVRQMQDTSFIFLTTDYHTPVPKFDNCRRIDKENLISVIQQYKFGVVFDRKLAV